ncbi:MAG: S46 family peptidase [Prevotella sp.]|nr:S46 family peptidase [Prevotella sp.]
MRYFQIYWRNISPAISHRIRGFEQIRKHSTVEHDYMLNGFCTQSFKEELPNEDLYGKKDRWSRIILTTYLFL